MTTAMMRVSTQTRDQIMTIAERDYGGVTADEALRRLATEHWELQCIAAVDAYRADDPSGWRDYLVEAAEWDAAQAPLAEPWENE